MPFIKFMNIGKKYYISVKNTERTSLMIYKKESRHPRSFLSYC